MDLLASNSLMAMAVGNEGFILINYASGGVDINDFYASLNCEMTIRSSNGFF